MATKKKRSKKNAGATRTTDQKSSGLTWMLMGLLVGLFVAFLVYLDEIPTQGGKQDKLSKQEQEKNKPSAQEKAPPPKHQFDFYTVLPDREVEVINVPAPKKTVVKKEPGKESKKEPGKVSSTQQTKKVNSVPSGTLYQLQVGAFKELTKADAMKARLAFLGVESNIQLMHVNGQKMYRVRVGPSTDAQKINRIKGQLKAQNINAFVQKLKG